MRWMLAVIVAIIIGAGVYLVRAKNPGMDTEREKHRMISPQEAKKRLETEKEIILVDVRTREEYLDKRIPGSLSLPLAQIEKEALLKLPDKKAIIFIYCRTGRRSAKAAELLLKMEYTGICELQGGIVNWPYATESGQ